MKVAATDMSGLSFIERLSALDKPDEAMIPNNMDDYSYFSWDCKSLIFVSIIVIAEMLEEIFIANLSLAVWSLIVGIPLFVLISSLIILGNKNSLMRPKNHKRLQYCAQL